MLAGTGGIALAIGVAVLLQRQGAAPTGTLRSVAAPVYERALGTTGARRLRQPIGVAVRGSEVFVADAARGEVAVYSTGGTWLRAFGAGRLSAPTYLAVSPSDGAVVVTDREREAAVRFTAGGSFESTVALPAPAGVSTATTRPLAVAFGADGTLYLSDVGERQRVVALDSSGRLRAATGMVVGGKALSFVNGIAPGDGGVLVSDSNNARVVALSSGLSVVASAPFPGLPRGACRASERDKGLYAVVDTTGATILIVDGRGMPVATAGPPASRAAGLSQPSGIASDGRGRLFVADTGNGRIAVFSWAGATDRSVLDGGADRSVWAFAAGALLLAAAIALHLTSLRRNRPLAI